MNLDKDQNPQNVGGYIIQEVDGRKKCPVFVTYEKAEDISSSTKYKDYFINNTRFNWMSKNKRYLNSPDVEAILNQETNNIQIPDGGHISFNHDEYSYRLMGSYCQ